MRAQNSSVERKGLEAVFYDRNIMHLRQTVLPDQALQNRDQRQNAGICRTATDTRATTYAGRFGLPL